MRAITSLALTLLVGVSAASAQSLPTLEERMSQADFHSTGLDKLSPEELTALNSWLQTHSGNIGHRVGGSRSAFYPDDGGRTAVTARIEGDFNGWRGNTVFTLDNGQEWQQTESTRYDAGAFSSPAVKIKPMIMGSWLMVVEGCGCSVRVQRIK